MRPYQRPSRSGPFFWLLFHITALTILGAGIAPSWWEAAQKSWSHELAVGVPPHAEKQARYIEKHLREPYVGYTRQEVLNEKFAIVALSHMASGWMNLATANDSWKPRAAEAMKEITRRALDRRTSPYLKPPGEVKRFGDQNLYLSHLNLILGIHRHLTGSTAHGALHTRITTHLRRVSMRDGDWHARSYPRPDHLKKRKKAYKWPADQSVTLASLYLYDKTRGTTLARQPIQGWLAYLKSQAKTEYDHLPASTLDEKVGYAKYPRGCALSWTVLYTNQFAPKQAKTLYDAYRKLYLQETFGFGGFREWPPGVDRGMDDDSGPIVMGIGTAATGLGVGAARLHKDKRAYTLVMRDAATFGFPTALAPERRYLTAPLIGEAILFHGTTARRWFHKQSEPTHADDAGAPFGVWIMLFLLAAFMLYSLMSIHENIQLLRRR